MEIDTGEKIVSGMFWRFGEKITAQGISFVVSIILARILLPSDYGVVAIVNVFITIADIFVTSGISTSLIQKKDATKLDFSTIFYCGLFLSCFLYLIMFLVAPVIANFYGMPILVSVIRVFSLKLPISAINSVQNAYVSRKMDFKKFFFATLFGTIVSAVLGIALALKGFGVWALVAQYLINSLIDTIVLFMVVSWKPTLEFSKEAAKPLISYGWKILATDLIGQVFNQLNSFIIGKRFTSADLAYYTQGKKFPDMIDNNLSGTLSAVLFPALSQQDSNEKIIQIRRKGLKMLAYIMCPLMVGMFAVADNMIIVLLTDKWIEAIFFVRIMCINTIINIMGTTLIQEIKAIGRSDITLKLELIKKPTFLLIIIISMFLGVKAIAFSLLINSTLAFVFNVIPVKKHIGFDIKMHIWDMMPSLLMSCGMGIVVYGIGCLEWNKAIELIIQVIVGGIFYLFLSIVTKNDMFIYVKKIFINKVLRRWNR